MLDIITSEKDMPTWAELKEMILETSRQMRENERQRKEELKRLKMKWEEDWKREEEKQKRKEEEEQKRREEEQKRREEEQKRREEEQKRREEEQKRREEEEKRREEEEKRREEEQKREEEEWKRQKEEWAQERKAFHKETVDLRNQFFSQSGHILEGLMEYPSLKMFQERGYNIHHCWKNYKRHRKSTGLKAEYDLVLVDDTIAIVVEVKINCTKGDIDHFIQQMGYFKELSPEYAHKEILAAVAAINYDRESDKYAHEKGLFVIRVDEYEDLFTLDPSDDDTLLRF